MAKSITIIDYGAGNIGSLKSAFEYIGVEVKIGKTPIDIASASTLVLPGVGAFDSACRQLNGLGISSIIRRAALVERKKILGICLGMQLFFDSSEEGNRRERGLQIFPQRVHRLKRLKNLPIPHTGFNSVNTVVDEGPSKEERQSRLLRGIDNRYFYFVHSYRVGITEKLNGVQLHTKYGEEFLSGYEEENIFLTQFHPEKSQTNGLQLLKNFIES
jgi:imidazole glycerol-phosphate synthase subunit HisH